MANRNETFDVEGVDELAAALARVGSEDRKRFMRTGFDEASAFIRHDMAQRARPFSSSLAREIGREVIVRKGEVTSANIGPRTKARGKKANREWYVSLARWAEFGTRSSVKKGGRIRLIGQKTQTDGVWSRAGRHGQTYKALGLPWGPFKSAKHRGHPAQPFMRPSVDNNVNRIANIMVSSIAAALRRAGFTVTAR